MPYKPARWVLSIVTSLFVMMSLSGCIEIYVDEGAVKEIAELFPSPSPVNYSDGTSDSTPDHDGFGSGFENDEGTVGINNPSWSSPRSIVSEIFDRTDFVDVFGPRFFSTGNDEGFVVAAICCSNLSESVYHWFRVEQGSWYEVDPFGGQGLSNPKFIEDIKVVSNQLKGVVYFSWFDDKGELYVNHFKPSDKTWGVPQAIEGAGSGTNYVAVSSDADPAVTLIWTEGAATINAQKYHVSDGLSADVMTLSLPDEIDGIGELTAVQLPSGKTMVAWQKTGLENQGIYVAAIEKDWRDLIDFIAVDEYDLSEQDLFGSRPSFSNMMFAASGDSVAIYALASKNKVQQIIQSSLQSNGSWGAAKSISNMMPDQNPLLYKVQDIVADLSGSIAVLWKNVHQAAYQVQLITDNTNIRIIELPSLIGKMATPVVSIEGTHLLSTWVEYTHTGDSLIVLRQDNSDAKYGITEVVHTLSATEQMFGRLPGLTLGYAEQPYVSWMTLSKLSGEMIRLDWVMSQRSMNRPLFTPSPMPTPFPMPTPQPIQSGLCVIEESVVPCPSSTPTPMPTTSPIPTQLPIPTLWPCTSVPEQDLCVPAPSPCVATPDGLACISAPLPTPISHGDGVHAPTPAPIPAPVPQYEHWDAPVAVVSETWMNNVAGEMQGPQIAAVDNGEIFMSTSRWDDYNVLTGAFQQIQNQVHIGMNGGRWVSTTPDDQAEIPAIAQRIQLTASSVSGDVYAHWQDDAVMHKLDIMPESNKLNFSHYSTETQSWILYHVVGVEGNYRVLVNDAGIAYLVWVSFADESNLQVLQFVPDEGFGEVKSLPIAGDYYGAMPTFALNQQGQLSVVWVAVDSPFMELQPTPMPRLLPGKNDEPPPIMPPDEPVIDGGTRGDEGNVFDIGTRSVDGGQLKPPLPFPSELPQFTMRMRMAQFDGVDWSEPKTIVDFQNPESFMFRGPNLIHGLAFDERNQPVIIASLLVGEMQYTVALFAIHFDGNGERLDPVNIDYNLGNVDGRFDEMPARVAYNHQGNIMVVWDEYQRRSLRSEQVTYVAQYVPNDGWQQPTVLPIDEAATNRRSTQLLMNQQGQAYVLMHNNYREGSETISVQSYDPSRGWQTRGDVLAVYHRRNQPSLRWDAPTMTLDNTGRAVVAWREVMRDELSRKYQIMLSTTR